MNVWQQLRETAFWQKDLLNGGNIRRHYREIKFNLENYHLPECRSYREKNLENFLNHALDSTPFYASFRGSKSILDFPVINKNIVRENYKSFRSSSFLDNPKNVPVVTSGSTGTPLKLWQNAGKRSRNSAEIIYFSQLAGYRLGARLLYMKVWNDLNRKKPLKRFMENIIPLPVFNYKDDEISNLIEIFRKSKAPTSIVAFGSTLENICHYLERIQAPEIEGNIISIIANSDSLSNRAKDTLEYYFGVSPMSRYSNMENGLLAQQVKGSGYDFRINWASFHIEILEMDSDKPVEFGQEGRVAVTDLFNHCMPLIRYDTGDIAIMDLEKDNPKAAPYLKSIEGRKADALYDTKGNLVTAHIVTLNMWKYPELRQYQFVQLGKKEYEFILNPIKSFSRETDLIQEFKGYLGWDARIGIRYVDEIPLLSSGKRRPLVNKMNAEAKS